MSWDPGQDLNYAEKQQVLADYWQRYGPFRFIVETGIWQGGGSAMQFRSERSEYVAIETDRGSAARAWERGYDVRVGDSAELLPQLLLARDAPAFFWLDAHLVEEAYQENSSPLLAELQAIVAWPHAARSVVLVDDVKMMGRDGWPSVRELLRAAYVRPGFWNVEIADDILRFTPQDPPKRG